MLIVAAVGALLLFIWFILDVVLLAFGATLVAIMLHAISSHLSARTRIPRGWALAATILLVLGAVALVGSLFGVQVRVQFNDLAERLPRAWEAFESKLGASDFGTRLLERAREAMPGMGHFNRALAGLAGALTLVASGTAQLLLVLFGGVYIALQPQLYRDGLLMLVPSPACERVAEVLEASGKALRLWLLGQFMAMAFVGLFSGIGLWLIGVPSALALGLLTALAEFVPFIGPVFAAVPALLIAFTQGTDAALWTLMLYVAVQQIQSNVVSPLITRRLLFLPPALVMFAVVALGLVLGPLGLIFAAPLTVVSCVVVSKLYIVGPEESR